VNWHYQGYLEKKRGGVQSTGCGVTEDEVSQFFHRCVGGYVRLMIASTGGKDEIAKYTSKSDTRQAGPWSNMENRKPRVPLIATITRQNPRVFEEKTTATPIVIQEKITATPIVAQMPTQVVSAVPIIAQDTITATVTPSATPVSAAPIVTQMATPVSVVIEEKTVATQASALVVKPSAVLTITIQDKPIDDEDMPLATSSSWQPGSDTETDEDKPPIGLMRKVEIDDDEDKPLVDLRKKVTDKGVKRSIERRQSVVRKRRGRPAKKQPMTRIEWNPVKKVTPPTAADLDPIERKESHVASVPKSVVEKKVERPVGPPDSFGTSDKTNVLLTPNTFVAIYDQTEPMGWYIGCITDVHDAYGDTECASIWWYKEDENVYGRHLRERQFFPSWLHPDESTRTRSMLKPVGHWKMDRFLVDKTDILIHGFQLNQGHVLRMETIARILYAYSMKVTSGYRSANADRQPPRQTPGDQRIIASMTQTMVSMSVTSL
jgi:hypothetical protein